MLERRMLIDLLKYLDNDEFIVTHILSYKILDGKYDAIAMLTNKKLIIYCKLIDSIYLKKIEYNLIENVIKFNNKGVYSIKIKFLDNEETLFNESSTNVNEFVDKLNEILDYIKLYGSLEFDTIVDNIEYIDEFTNEQTTKSVNKINEYNNRLINHNHNHYHYNTQVVDNQYHNVTNKKKSKSIILGSILLSLGIVFLAGISYQETYDAEDIKSPIELYNSNKTEAEQNKNEWQVYGEKYIEIKNIDCGYMNSFLDGRIPGLTLEVKNNGDKTISKLVLTAYFQDGNGNDIYEDDLWIIDAGGFLDDFGVLKPNYSWKNNKGTFKSFSQVPSEWKEGAIKLEIKKIEFEN